MEVARYGWWYAVRDSEEPGAGAVVVTRAWLDGIKAGALD